MRGFGRGKWREMMYYNIKINIIFKKFKQLYMLVQKSYNIQLINKQRKIQK